MTKPLRVVVAPDKFKGSLSATDVAEIVAAALRAHPAGADVVQHPVADGGEGTVERALSSGFSAVSTTVTGPLGHPVTATFALRDGVAVLEMASAAGLALLPSGPSRETARRATTFGVGEPSSRLPPREPDEWSWVRAGAPPPMVEPARWPPWASR